MTDKQKSLAALSFLSQSCTVALAEIASLPADLDSLLALVYATTTKLSLALNPAAPSYSASIPLLQDLAQHVSALAHGTRLLHGAALIKDVGHRLTEIIEALRALVQTFLNNAGEDYLIRTGILHDLITNARGPSGIPKDNQAAVHKSWKSDGESLDDNLQEITRLIKEAESPQDDLDDGWDEIGLGHAGTSLDKDELARAKNVHKVLRLTTLLHKRISLDLLAYPSSAPVSVFDTLLALSNQLLSTSDDLVATLYTPQELPYVRQEILQLAKIATSLQTQVALLLPATDQLSAQLLALSVDDGSTAASPTKKRADKKWFDTCVDQIARLCTSVSESTSQMENHNSGT